MVFREKKKTKIMTSVMKLRKEIMDRAKFYRIKNIIMIQEMLIEVLARRQFNGTSI